MKKVFTLLTAAILVFGLSSMAMAAYTFDMGDNSSMSGPAFSDPGLALQYSINANLGSNVFTLNSGESFTMEFASIWTNETALNDDDFIPQDIFANIHFDNPDLIGAVGGTSVGFLGGFLWHKSGFDLTWNGPVEIDLGGGDLLTLALSDGHFVNGGWQGPEGAGGTLDLTVTYTHTPVPIPGAVWLLGSGLVGIAGLRRKFQG